MSQPKSTTPKQAHPGILLRRTSVLNVWIAIVPVKYAPPVSPICERIPAHRHETSFPLHARFWIVIPCVLHKVPTYNSKRLSHELPPQKSKHTPSVTAFALAHSALIIIDMLLNALPSISDAMYAPSCVWKNAREWCWFALDRRFTRAARGSHEYRTKTARMASTEIVANNTIA